MRYPRIGEARALLACQVVARRIAFLVFACCALAVPADVSAQPTAGLAEKLGAQQRIFVTDRHGVETEGRFVRLSSDDITLLVDGAERQFPLKNIGRIEKRDRLWNGMVIGMASSALMGMAAAGASCSPHCARDMTVGALAFGAAGAGIGALVDFGIHGYDSVDGPSLPSPRAFSIPPPVTSLDDLWLRVRQGDTIEVFTRGGQKVTAKFVSISSAALTLAIDGDPRAIQTGDVRRVTRAGNRYRAGALWGGVIFGALGLLASSAGCSGSDCGDAGFVALFMGSAGALWGAGIGALIPRHPTVYQATTPAATRIVPLVRPDGVGVALARQF